MSSGDLPDPSASGSANGSVSRAMGGPACGSARRSGRDVSGSTAGRARLNGVESFQEPNVGEVIRGMSPADQLRRKIRVTKIIALIEAVSYCFLAFFMFRKYALDMRGGWNQFWLRFVAYFHGMGAIAFAVMIFDIYRPMKWKIPFVIATLLGPPGALLAHWKLRTQPFPTEVRKQDMLF